MYLFGYPSLTLKLQKILGKEILVPEFTSCCCLCENASWPFFLTQNDIFISPKTAGITFPIPRKFEPKNTPVFHHFHHTLIRKS